LKTSKYLVVLITFIFFTACNSGNKENQSSQDNEPAETYALDTPNDYQNNFYDNDDYELLLAKLDSLGLNYETISLKEESLRYAKPEWKNREYDAGRAFNITKSDTIQFENFKFEIEFDDKMNFNENANAYYGGIKSMKVFYKENQVQTLTNIEDARALGIVELYMDDFNQDGHIDIKIPLTDNFPYYLMFNPKTKQFSHLEEWDYIKVSQTNKKQKQFFTSPDGSANYGNYYLIQINGNKLIKLKKFYYHTIKEQRDTFITIVHLENE